MDIIGQGIQRNKWYNIFPEARLNIILTYLAQIPNRLILPIRCEICILRHKVQKNIQREYDLGCKFNFLVKDYIVKVVSKNWLPGIVVAWEDATWDKKYSPACYEQTVSSENQVLLDKINRSPKLLNPEFIWVVRRQIMMLIVLNKLVSTLLFRNTKFNISLADILCWKTVIDLVHVVICFFLVAYLNYLFR